MGGKDRRQVQIKEESSLAVSGVTISTNLDFIYFSKEEKKIQGTSETRGRT